MDVNGQKDVKAVIAGNISNPFITEYTPKERSKLRALHEDGSAEIQVNAKKNACEKLTKLPEGKHILSIYGDNSSYPHTSLSHIITWI